MRQLGLTLLVDAAHWAVLSAGELVLTAEQLSDVPSSSLDAVVLRRPWAGRGEARRLLDLSHRLLRPGGTLVASELDAEMLLDGPTARYPVAAVWRSPGAPVDALRSSTISPAVLSTDAVAARFDDVVVTRYDEVGGRYPSMAAFWGSLPEGGWRGDSWMAPARRASFLETAPPVSGSAPVIDQEPWYAVTGLRP